MPDRDIIIPKKAARYIGEASEEELRVLLCAFSGLSPAELGLTPEAAERAERFWARRSVILPERTSPPDTSMPEFDSDTVSSDISSRSELRFMIDKIQKLMGKTLSVAEINIFYGMVEWHGLPPEVVLVLVERCVHKNKTMIKYMEKVASEWARDGISTYEEAEMRVRREDAGDEYEQKLRRALSLERPLSPSERTHAARWCENSIPVELCLSAYDITVRNTGKLSFAYMNKILMSWKEKGITSEKDLKAESSGSKPYRPAPQRGANDGAGRKSGSDYDAYEQLSKQYIKSKMKGEDK